jgi:hypothetical protein
MKKLDPVKTQDRECSALMMTIVALVVSLATALPAAAAVNGGPPVPVPDDLEVPEGNKAYLVGHAYGTQNYVCLPTDTGFAWTFFGPQATLFDRHGRQIITHFLSPNPAQNGAPRATWQHSRDSSTVWAAAIATYTDSDYVAPGAIPWLLLEVVGAQYGPWWGGALTATTYVQRVNTSGGVAPATGCSASTDVGKKALVPYTTDYVFYRRKLKD